MQVERYTGEGEGRGTDRCGSSRGERFGGSIPDTEISEHGPRALAVSVLHIKTYANFLPRKRDRPGDRDVPDSARCETCRGCEKV